MISTVRRKSGILIRVVVLILAFETFFEGAQALAQRATQLGQATMAEEQHDNGQNEKMAETESEHNTLNVSLNEG